MPKLYVANAEEALPTNDILFSKYFSAKTTNIYCRLLTELHPGDKLLVPEAVATSFGAYMNRLLGIGGGEQTVIQVEQVGCQLLADLILNDSRVMEELRNKFRAPEWYLEAFIETANVIRLAQALDLPTRGTAPELVEAGLIETYNSKSQFKRIAREAGLPTVPGTYATTATELADKVRQLGRHYRRLMLRKAKYAGGHGNLAGTMDELLPQLNSWYNEGAVLVEPFLDIEEVAGSLVRITDHNLEFLCIDRQIIHNSGWVGFTMPFCPQDMEALYGDFNIDKVRLDALELAHQAQLRGVRGLMNLDWAFTRNHRDEPIILECNLRHNGLSYIVEFAQAYFGPNWGEQTVYCREYVPCALPDFEQLRRRLSQLCWRGEKVFIDEPGRSRGLVITHPPRQGIVALAIFGPDQEYIDGVRLLAEQAMAS